MFPRVKILFRLRGKSDSLLGWVKIMPENLLPSFFQFLRKCFLNLVSDLNFLENAFQFFQLFFGSAFFEHGIRLEFEIFLLRFFCIFNLQYLHETVCVRVCVDDFFVIFSVVFLSAF